MTSHREIISSANTLKDQYSQTGDPSFIHQAIEELETFISSERFENLSISDRSGILVRLAIEYYFLYSIEGSSEYLEGGRRNVDAAIDAVTSEDGIDRLLVDTVATALRTSDQTSGIEEAIEKSIEVHNLLLHELADEDDSGKAGTLTNLGNAYRRLYEITEDRAHLEMAIECHKQALRLSKEGTHTYAMICSNLGNALRQMHEITGELELLNEAIGLQEEAVEYANSYGDQTYGLFQFTLSLSFFSRFLETKRIEDADQSVEHLVSSINKSRERSWERIDRSLNLARLLYHRFLISRDRNDLDSAIAIFEAYRDALSDSDRRMPEILIESSQAYRLKYELDGDMVALETAILCLEEHAKGPTSNPKSLAFAESVSNLAILYGARYEVTQDISLLCKSKSAFEKALECDIGEDPLVARCHFNLANTLDLLYSSTGDRKYLDQAIDHRNIAIELTEAGSDELAGRLAGLSQDLFRLFQLEHDAQHLETAIENLDSALELSTSSDIELANILYFRARVLSYRFALIGGTADQEEVFANLRRAAELVAGKSHVGSLKIGSAWGYEAFYQEDWELAAEGFQIALDAADMLFEVQVSWRYKEYWRKEAFHLYQYAAFAFAKCGEIEQAVRAIERGRAKSLFENTRLVHPDIRRLSDQSKELASELVDLLTEINQLSRLETSQEIGNIYLTSAEELTYKRGKLNRLLGRIRAMEGFTEFLRPPNMEEIYEVAQLRPLVYTAVTHLGCIVIIIQDQRNVEFLSIDEFNTLRIHEKLGWITRTFYPRFGDAIDYMCGWLGDSIMGRLHRLLHERGETEATIISQGILAILPLHSAWVLDKSTGDRHYIIDDISISYAPSAASLRLIQRKGDKGLQSILAIEDPTMTLPHAPSEVAGVLRHFDQKELLGGSKVTKKKVLEYIDSTDILHFCCHAFSNAADPFENALIMANNETITLADVLQYTLERTSLVVLSACETGLIGQDLPDEIIGFPTAFLQMGARSVVSSMWPVDDKSTSLLMEEFYRNIVEGGAQPAEALRRAQLSLRGGELSHDDFSHPFYWGSFFVTGL